MCINCSEAKIETLLAVDAPLSIVYCILSLFLSRVKKSLTLFFILLLLICSHLYAQSLKINGKVIDESTGETIPYAVVVLKSSHAGTSADSSGNFRLNIIGRRDTLLIQ